MKKRLILYPILGLLLYVLLSSYSEGPLHDGAGNLTGAGGVTGCSTSGSCHGGTPTTGIGVTVQLLSGSTPVTTYVPGATYTIKISGTNSTLFTLPRFGFQVSVVRATGAGTSGAINAGTFSGFPDSTAYIASGFGSSVGAWEHFVSLSVSAALSATTGGGTPGGTYVKTASWTAPAAGTGCVIIYGALNAVNFDGGSGGDYWNTATPVTICESSAGITGPTTVCVGSTITLSDAVTGGTWSSGATATATVTSGGIVTGVAPGPVTISYTTGSTSTYTITVNAVPSTIAGSLSVCQGSSTGLTDPSGIGTWISSNASVATVALPIGTVGGVVTGSSSPATSNITFTLATTGCTTTSIVTVNPLPSIITGIMTVCQGTTTTLADATTGGTWASGSTGIATVTSSGVVSGVATGSASPATAVITYTSPLGCTKTATVTVNPVPAAISGSTTVCTGVTITLTDVTTGGTWSSGTTSAATITGTGTVTGTGTGGTTLISYTVGGCTASTTVTVNVSPPAISGTTSICAGTGTTLTDLVTGGTWVSNNTTVATIGLSSGAVTGGANPGGSALITYTSPTGCTVTAPLTINAQPTSIIGTTSICPGTTTNLTDAITGGTWSSTSTAVASIGLGSGSLTGGLSPGGLTTITYAILGCTATTVVTVNPTPPAITGSFIICGGSATTLADAITGGTWSSNNTSIASIGLSSGLLTGGGGPGGSAIITYVPPTGCPVTTTITVNASPALISGTTTLCSGATSTLSDGTTGGTWVSGNTGVATVTGTGTVTGVGLGGITNITYTANGCSTSTSVTVNPSPASISGTTNICSGATATLTDATTGGSWSSSSTTVASIGSSSGLLTVGAGPGGSTIITYAVLGCTATSAITVSPIPPTITGTLTICTSQSTTLNDGITGGTWSSTNSAAATIGSGSGILTGVPGTGGTSLITYTTPAGCSVTTTITVNTLPSGITGTASICSGSTSTLADGTSGGTWSSSNTSVATVLPGSGTVTGIGTGGTSTISYNLSTGCNVTVVVTVNPLPPSIGGNPSVCEGLTSLLSDATTGGTWTSSNTSTATVVTGTGLVTGMISGTSQITYTPPSGCTTSKIVTVNPLPSTISGTPSVCVGLTTSLGNTTTGGAWSSSNTSVATVGTSSGIVKGVLSGTTIITYSVGAGCTATIVVTVNPLAPITGPTSLCSGTTITLADAVSGGTWSSSNNLVATVLPGSGTVTSVSSGNVFISYILPTGCTASTTVTVVSTPSGISGTPSVCVNSTTPLSDPGGGNWTSSNTGVATVVFGSGVVTGVANGTAIITYSLGTSCNATMIVTVNPLPGSITGTTHACVGATTTLFDGTTGGTWSSGSTTVATIDASSGTVTGLIPNTTSITYTAVTGCTTSTTITINPLPGAISGATAICIGGTTGLTDASSVGTWSSIPTSVATVTPLGLVSGVTPGTATIAFALPVTGCAITTVVTVNSLPPSITGTTNVCIGATTALNDLSTGGSWNSSLTGVATVGSATGIVSGVLNGTSTITYSLGAGCTVSKIITVNALPSGISGPTAVCLGSTILLTDGTSGGTWSSSTPAIATMLPGSGTVTSVTQGIDTISYRITSTGCSRALTVTVNPLPAFITGSTHLCLGSTTALDDATTGGTWLSSAPSVASVGSITGVVVSLSPGSSVITYKLPTGCTTTSSVTVNPLPSSITGTASACAGSTASLFDATSGGTWSSSTPGVATVLPGSGTATGVTAGVDTIIYTAPTGCSRTVALTINPVPSGISGVVNICSGATTHLTDAITGGTWSSGSTSVASVGLTSGLVTGGTGTGTANITYRLASGCSTSIPVVVNPLPVAITGTTIVCIGATAILADVTTAGTWSSSTIGVATVDPVTGTVSGIGAGTAVITYSLATGCNRTTIVTANPVPSSITGTAVVCEGSTVTLGDLSTGGTWSSSTTSISTTTGSTGIFTGILSGTTSITYTVAGCSTSETLTVNPAPDAISGLPHVCIGSSVLLGETTTGGTWSSSAGAATIDVSTGLVNGISSGSTTISYISPLGCAALLPFTVNTLPGTIDGTTSVCAGSSSTLSDLPDMGTWVSSNTAVATIGSSSGTAVGVTAGTSSVTFTLATGCTASTTLTVNPSPTPLTGAATVCQGSVTTLTDDITGGTWTSSSAGITTVSGSGAVTGISAGTSSITYTLAGGCSTRLLVTVHPSPATIAGTMQICDGLTTLLSDASGGGTWSSSTPRVANIDGTGDVTTLGPGTTTISYTLATGCSSTAVVTVNPLPAGIAGSTIVCVGGTITLTDAVNGGTWSSSDNTIATVNPTTGTVTGVSEASSIITYTLPTGCMTTVTLTDNCNVGVKQITQSTPEVNIFPNPNSGDFTIDGALDTKNDGAVIFEITDMIGKTIYRGVMTATNGKVNQRLELGNNIANGVYLITIHSENEKTVLHFVIDK